jgi:hypothetical protein
MLYPKAHCISLLVCILGVIYAAPLNDDLKGEGYSNASLLNRGNETVVSPDCPDCAPPPPQGKCCVASCGVCDPDNIYCGVCA